jgi:hypothetical protein
MSINKIRTVLYTAARLLGDLNAILKGKIGQRIARRAAGRVTGRMLGRLFDMIFKKK